jgi:hypothetical protein
MLVLLLLLAFLLGLFAAYSGSLWMHLALGRVLAAGEFQFGVDPFSAIAGGQNWVNATWLADLVLYALYSLLGGAGLVVVKALLAVVIAVLLVQVRRPGESWWPSVFCVGLALLALSARLHVDPFVFSLVLLAATVYLLFREVPEREGGPRWSRLWLLPPLFALWANLDPWFILGPLTVALVLLGELLQGLGQVGDEAAAGRRRVRTLALVLPAGLAACLLNPQLHRVFVLPLELADLVLRTGGWLPAGMLSSGEALHQIGRQDPGIFQYLTYWLSPLSEDYWSVAGRGLNVAGMAFFVLLVLGLGSFVLSALTVGGDRLAGYPWSRLLVWGVFAAFAVAQARLIPLFAVVAGPITALNLQDYRRQALGTELRTTGRWLAWSLGGRAATLLALLALAVLAWPGWLHPVTADPRGSHRVGWEIHPDPLLKGAAEQLGRWQDEGKLGRGFNYNPDVSYYCAWFAPQVKSYYDFRFDLFAGRAEQIGALRRAVRELTVPDKHGRLGPPTELERLLREDRLDHVVLTDFSRDRVIKAVTERLLQEPYEWAHLYGNGRAVVFGWEDPRARGRGRVFREIAVTPAARVFGARRPEPPLPDGPRPFLEDREPWRDILFGPPAPSGEGERADYWMGYYDVLNKRDVVLYRARVQAANLFWDAGAWGGCYTLALAGAGPLAAPLTVGTRLGGLERTLQPADLGPAGAPLLALQAARRAAASDPNDPAAYRRLAAAVDYLWQKQEGYWTRQARVPHQALRPTLRRLQWTAAVTTLVRLDPSRYDARLALGRMYLDDLHYLDVALDHYTAALELLKVRRPAAGQGEAYRREREALDAHVRRLSSEVSQRREYFDLHTVGEGFMAKVAKALDVPYQPRNDKNQAFADPRGLGLAKPALKTLEETKAARLSTDQEKTFLAIRQLQLLLELGEVRKVQQLLGENEDLAKMFPLVEAELAAVVGDYPLFDRAMQRVEAGPQATATLVRDAYRPVLVACLAVDPRLPVPPAVRVGEFVSWQRPVAHRLQQLAEPRFLRGLLALDNGDTALAARCFREARDLLTASADFPDRPILERYVSLLEENRKEGAE